MQHAAASAVYKQYYLRKRAWLSWSVVHIRALFIMRACAWRELSAQLGATQLSAQLGAIQDDRINSKY